MPKLSTFHIILDSILINFGVYGFITEDYDWIIRDCVYAHKISIAFNI